MDDATPTEREAVLLRWYSLHPEAPPTQGPSEAEAAILLQEVRERAGAVEAEAFKLLKRQMRVTNAKSPDSRQSIASFVIIIIALVIAALLYGLYARMAR